MSEGGNEKSAQFSVTLSQKNRQKLAEDNLLLVIKIAKQYKNLGLLYEDLIGLGNIGLVYASNKFDPNLGFEFSTYASDCIRGEICRGLDYNSGVHVPVNKAQKARMVFEEYGRMEKQLGYKPTIEELAFKIGMNSKKVQDLLNASMAKYPTSLDAPISAEGSTLKDLIPEDHLTPDKVITEKEAEEKWVQIIRSTCELKLTNRDGKILFMKFGIFGYDEKGSTFAEIGKKFGLSSERVRQIIGKSYKKLKLVPKIRQAYEEVLAA